VDLRANRFRTVVSDDDLRRVIRTGVPAAGMPPVTIGEEAMTALVAFIRAGMDTDGSATSLTIGDAVRGREIVHGKAGCLACHRVHDRGGRSAPDLSHVASSRSPASIHLSLLDPTRAMLPINRPIRAITRDGRTIAGRRLNEDTYTLLIADEDGRLQALLKEDLREYEVLTTSPMPSYRDTLSQTEIADVFGYLLTLKDTGGVSGR
jgi:putative heme-binding domain-containing protein